MKTNINKIIWGILFILIILFILYFFVFNKNNKEYVRTFEYMDTYIEVRIYGSSKNKINKMLDRIENLYEEYSILTDKYNEYDGVNNVYYINNNNLISKEMMEIGALGSCAVSANALRGFFLFPAKTSPDRRLMAVDSPALPFFSPSAVV